MNCQGDIKVLRGSKHDIVVEMAVGFARDSERTHERALTACLDRAFKFMGRFHRVAQRQMRDGNEAPCGIATKLGDPAIIGSAVRAR